jgi:thiamine-monophosphate kinase
MSSAIDVSDGLHADAGHLARASAVELCINLDQLPFSQSVLGLTSEAERVNAALYGGDDYELCFTAETACRDRIGEIAASAGLRVTEIGEVRHGNGVSLFDRGVAATADHQRGFDHFSRKETP